MESDSVGIERADVGDAKLVDEEFRKFENTREDFGGAANDRLIMRFSGHLRVVIANHGDAGRGRDADGFGGREGFQETLHHGERLAAIAGVVMHLSAATLSGREVDCVA